MRRIICLIGIIGIIYIMLAAHFYTSPVTGGYWELVDEGDYRNAGEIWIPQKDYSNAPWYEKVGEEYGMLTILVGIGLLYGALKK